MGRGQKHRQRQKRKKSSESDTEHKQRKQSKYGGTLTSDILSAANSVLYACDIESDSEYYSDDNSGNVSVFMNTQNTLDRNITIDNVISNHENMASNDQGGAGGMQELVGQVREILTTVKDVKRNQEELRRSLEQKIEIAKNEMTGHINAQITSLRDQLTSDLSKETVRIDGLLTSVQSFEARLTSLEQAKITVQSNNRTNDVQTARPKLNPLNDPDLTVIASGLPYDDGEDILAKAKLLISALGDEVNNSVSVEAAKRLPSRFSDKPGWVKISFRSLQEKVTVLRKKMSLRSHDVYNRVFLKSSKSSYQRISEYNARAILRNIPQGNNFRIDASGRIKERTSNTASTTAPPNGGGPSADAH